MKKFVFQFTALLIMIFGAIYLSVPGIKPNFLFTTPGEKNSNKVITINNVKINVEIADTQDKRTKGLSGRDSLPADSGMLFIFPKEERYSFWMKGLKFPLDIIWIKGDNIVDILTNVKPPENGQKDETLPIFQPVVVVNKVLEVNTGTVDRLQIRVGDKLIVSDK